MIKHIIGIDPGKNGGIAVLTLKRNRVHEDWWFIDKDWWFIDKARVEVFSEEALVKTCEQYGTKTKNAIVYLENVHAMPKQGVSSTFNFGKNFGFIQGAIKQAGLDLVLVTPQTWKKEIGCTADKSTSIKVCKELFPYVNLLASTRCRKDHDGMAEALLIAEYGRRHYNGRE